MSPTTSSVPERKTHTAWPLFQARNVTLVVTDQVLLSGGNFLTLLVFARSLAPASFGNFAIGLSFVQLVKSLNIALVTTPLMAVGGAMGDRQRAGYRWALLRMQAAITVVAVLCMIAGSVVFAAYSNGAASSSLLPLIAALVALLLQEFVRRSLLAEMRAGAALLNDVIRYGIQLPTLFACQAHGLLGVDVAWVILALSSGVAAILGLKQITFRHEPSLRRQLCWYRETIDYGKWLAGHYVGVWVVERWYLVGVAALLSTTEVGVLAACATLLGAGNVFYLSLENYAVPLLARRIPAEGRTALRGAIRRLLLVVGLAVGAACALVALAGDPLMKHLYGLEYAGYGWFLGLVALQSFLGYFGRVAAIVLKALRQTRDVFWAYSFAAVVTVATSVPLIVRFGLLGAGIGLVIAQLALTVPLVFRLLAHGDPSLLGLGGLPVAVLNGARKA